MVIVKESDVVRVIGALAPETSNARSYFKRTVNRNTTRIATTDIQSTVGNIPVIKRGSTGFRPVMQGGIDLVAGSDPNVYEGYLSTTQLFRVDRSGAALMMLADGTRTIGEIAAQASQTLGEPVDAADAAEFFVTLGQEGYLQNEVLVNLLEIAG